MELNLKNNYRLGTNPLWGAFSGGVQPFQIEAKAS